MWLVPSCTVAGIAWLSGAIPACLCLSSSQSWGSPCPLGTSSPCPSPPTQIPGHPPATVANTQHHTARPGLTCPSSPAAPTTRHRGGRFFPGVTQCPPAALAAPVPHCPPSVTHQGGHSTVHPALGWDAGARARSQGGRTRARVMRCPSLVLQELAHPDGEEAGAKQPSGKSWQDPT